VTQTLANLYNHQYLLILFAGNGLDLFFFSTTQIRYVWSLVKWEEQYYVFL